MLRFFKSNHPLTIVLLVLFALLLRAVTFLYPESHEAEFYNPLAKLLLWAVKKIPFNQTLVQNCLATIITIVQALYFNRILNKYKITNSGSFLPAYCYLILCSLFTDFLYFTPTLIANFFLLLTLDRLFAVYRHEKMNSEIFDLGFTISLGSLFYFPTMAFLAFILFGLATLRPVKVNEWFVVLVGVVVPYFLTGVYYFWYDILPEFWQNITIYKFQQDQLYFVFDYRVAVISILLAAFAAWAVYIVQSNYFKTVVQIRNYFVVLFWFAVLGFLTVFLQSAIRIEHFIWLNIPIAAVLAYAIPEIRKAWIAEIAHLVLLLLIVYFQYNPIFFK